MAKVRAKQPDPPVRGEGLLRRLERLMLRVDRGLEAALPGPLNPLSQTGAIANVCFLIAVASGVLLLLWYVPSVDKAYDSLDALETGSLGAWTRALHRYSSDAAIFFVALHALRLLLARRFVGARWVAWTTGVLLVGLLWFVGWLGYWLVWDARAQVVATATARSLEWLPVFTDPLSRMFLEDGMVSTALFVIVFFFHMLIPLAIGAALWAHISRVSRARFLTPRPLTMAVAVTLAVVSLLVPVSSAGPADLGQVPHGLSGDLWYLFPLLVTERLGGGAIFALGLLGTCLFGAVPWLLARGEPQKAEIDTNKCNGCTLCVQDCPYDAIVMVPRKDGRDRYELQAQIDPGKCVGCGICAGACDPGGIGLPQMPVMDERRQIDAYVDEALARHDEPLVAFLCANSAGGDFEVDDQGRSPQLPGFHVVPVPCSGWVHPLSLERAIRRGAAGAMVVGCSGHDPYYREGTHWLRDRLLARREPKLRREKIEVERIRFVTLDRSRPDTLREQAATMRAELAGEATAEAAGPGRARMALGAVLVSAAFTLPVVLLADAPMPTGAEPATELVVTFKHRPDPIEDCRTPDAAELAKLPKHMRREKICERARPPVKVEVEIDARPRHSATYQPHGLSSDGPSVGTVSLPLSAGSHDVVVRVGEQRWEGEVEVAERRRRVLVFDDSHGFTLAPLTHHEEPNHAED